MSIKKIMAATAVGGALAVSAFSAQAISLKVLFTDLDANVSQLVSGVDDLDFTGTVGEWNIEFDVDANEFIGFGVSELVQSQLSAGTQRIGFGANAPFNPNPQGRLLVQVVGTGFGEGANAPFPSALGFTVQGNGLGGSLEGRGFVNDSNDDLVEGPPVEFPSEEQIGDPLVFVEEDFSPINPSWFGGTSENGVLEDPFSISLSFLIVHDGDGFSVNDDRTTLTATASAVALPVPVPAALPLFATALLGLGLLGRRRMRG